MHIALLQIRSTPLWPGLPGPATLLFNHPIRVIMTILSRLPISTNNNDKHYEALVRRQRKGIRTMLLPEITILFQKDLL